MELPLHLELEERFDPGLGRDDPFGQNNVLHGDELDVADLIRQLIDSALPLMLACNENCPGLCPECGRKRDGTMPLPAPGVTHDGKSQMENPALENA